METCGPRCSILVIGGGASGVIMAAHLLRRHSGIAVTIVEKRAALGRGIAYSTPEPDHLLNVRAANMSALADEPRHFAAWLEARGVTADMNGHYAPRRLYGQYLGELAEVGCVTGRLTRVTGACEALSTREDGVEARLADGTRLRADAAVLATGHEENPLGERPYAVRFGSGDDAALDADAPVLILGTGLSTVDVWLTLQARGHRGPVTALSRRGLMPTAHRRWMAPALIPRTDLPLGAGPAAFLGWLRARARDFEREGGDWRTAVDALRPFNQAIWQSWTPAEQRGFLRHAKTPWHIHRHRMAPEIALRIAQALKRNSFRVVAGRLRAVEKQGDRWRVTFRPKGAAGDEILTAARIYDCCGVATDPHASSNPLIHALLAAGTARCDPMRIGLDVSKDCAVIDGSGVPSARLFAVGPLTRGTFLEIEAVPDIRVQCAALAPRLLQAPAQELQPIFRGHDLRAQPSEPLPDSRTAP